MRRLPLFVVLAIGCRTKDVKVDTQPVDDDTGAEVVDADGGTSAPAAFLVDILSVNDAPTLDLNGLHRGGTGYSSTMGEHERVLGVALVDADLYVGDADGTLIVRGRVAYDPAGVGYSATDFPVRLF